MEECQRGCLAKVEELLKSGADSTVQNSFDETALFLAIPTSEKKSPQWNEDTKGILKLLCENPINWNHRYQGLNPLQYAVARATVPILQFLLQLDPPRSIQHEAMIHDWVCRGGDAIDIFIKENPSVGDNISMNQEMCERIKKQHIQFIRKIDLQMLERI